MKKGLIYLVLAVGLLSFVSCATTFMPLSQVPDAQWVGEVTASFESTAHIRPGFLGGAGYALAGVGGVMMGAGIAQGEGAMIGAGAATAGVGLAGALVQDLVFNAPRRARLNRAAQEALLTAAMQRHPTENIDVRDIRWTHVRATGVGRSHLYNATGTIITQ